jgi:hypothetical protein
MSRAGRRKALAICDVCYVSAAVMSSKVKVTAMTSFVKEFVLRRQTELRPKPTVSVVE